MKKKINLLQLLSVILLLNCSSPNARRYERIKERLNDKYFSHIYYDRELKILNQIISTTNDTILKINVLKTRDSLLEFKTFLEDINLNYTFKTQDSFIKYQKELSVLKGNKTSFCNSYRLILNGRKDVVFTKEQKTVIKKYGDKFCPKVKDEIRSYNSYSSSISDTQIQNMLSSWDGSLPALKELVKKNLNDEDSFKHIQTGYINKGSYVEIKMIYSAKNAYNATIKSYIKVKVNSKGVIKEIISASN